MPGDRGAADPDIDHLTPRERECLRLVYEHLSSKQIARQLGISKHTVDTHVDKARQRLGATDRYDAARRMAASERAAGIPTQSGPDTNRIGDDGRIGLAPPRTGSVSSEPSRQDPFLEDGEPGARAAPGGGRVPPDLARTADAGDGDAGLHLGTAGTATGQPLGFAQPGGDHPSAGFWTAQTGPLQAARNGAARDPLSEVDAHGRFLTAGPLAWGGRGNALGPFARLGLILLIAIASAVAFGGVLAGLHALKDLV